MSEQGVTAWREKVRGRLAAVSRRARIVILLTLSFVAAFLVLIGLKIMKDYNDTLYMAERDTSQTVTVLAEQVRTNFLNISTSLDYMGQTHVSADGALQSLTTAESETLRARLNALALFQNVILYNRSAETLFTLDPDQPLPDAPQEAGFFRAHMDTGASDAPQDGVFLEEHGYILISQRVADMSGETLGVAVALLRNDYLSHLAAKTALPKTTTLTLANTQGRILSTTQRFQTKNIDVTYALGVPTEWPRQGESSLAYAWTQTNDQVLVAVSPVPSTPLKLYVDQTVSDILSLWYSSLQFYALMVLAPTFFGAGVCGILIRQLDQRNAAIEAHRASKARLNLAVEGAKCGIWDWDLDTNRMFWSESMYGILGREPGSTELDLADVRELMHSDDRDVLAEIADETRKETEGYDRVFRLRHAHGHWVWVHAKGQLLTQNKTEDSPASKRIMGIAIDITQLKNAENRVNEIEAQLRDAIENISESFVLWDHSNRLVICNKKFAEYYQLDESLLIPGTRYDDLMEQAQAAHILLESGQAVQRPLLTTSVKQKESELVFVGEKWLHISTRLTGDGGHVSVATNVTPLKEQEDELLQNEKKLKQYVQELEDSQSRLRQESEDRAELAVKCASEKARAEEANRSKTEFLANMSHELRTPLNAIMGFAQIMSENMFGPLGDEKYETYSKDILDSAQYLLTLINDILDMSKIETGKMKLESESVALGHIIQSCLRLVEPRMHEADLKFHYDPPALPTVYVDSRALKQVVLNLLSNAVKFTPAGGNVTLRAEVKPKTVILTIEDTGIGIAANHLERIGKPFEQIENQHTKSHKGSGLGLAIAKSLTELMGGTLTIQSELGIGTQIRVSIPREKQAVSAAEPTDQSA